MKKINQLSNLLTPVLLMGLIALVSFSLNEQYNNKGEVKGLNKDVIYINSKIEQVGENCKEKNRITNIRINDTNDVARSDRSKNSKEHNAILKELNTVTYYLKQTSKEFRQMKEYMAEKVCNEYDSLCIQFSDSVKVRGGFKDSLICEEEGFIY